MTAILVAFGVGVVCGVAFAFARVPVPAPPTAAGVVGIAGITLGWYFVRRLWLHG